MNEPLIREPLFRPPRAPERKPGGASDRPKAPPPSDEAFPAAGAFG